MKKTLINIALGLTSTVLSLAQASNGGSAAATSGYYNRDKNT